MRGVAWQSILISLLFSLGWWLLSNSLSVLLMSAVLSVVANARQPRIVEAMTHATIIGLVCMMADIYLHRLP